MGAKDRERHRIANRKYAASRRGKRTKRRWWRNWIRVPENRRLHNDRRRDLSLRAAGVHVHSKPPTLEGVWKIARGKCWACGLPVPFPGYETQTAEGATIHHKKPVSKGGDHHPRNCAMTHRGCNARLADDDIPDIVTAPVWAR